ncbi:hypothetical protein AHAS_Ahas05G0280800 [Arachis hypogaea]
MNFKATYKTNDEDEDDDRRGEAVVKNVVVPPTVNSQPMCSLDLDAMHATQFSKYANIGVADPKDGEFRIRMEYSSRNQSSRQFGVTLSPKELITLFISPSHRRSTQTEDVTPNISLNKLPSV